MGEITVSLRSSFDAVRDAAGAVREHCAGEGLGDMDVAMIELALVEALNNAVEHAYGGREDGEIRLRLAIDASRVEADVLDEGAPVDQVAVDAAISANAEDRAVAEDAGESGDRASLREGGRGLGIIRGVFDEVTFTREGGANRLHLVRHREPAAR